MDLMNFYNTNEDFKGYIDRYRRKNDISLEELFKHQIIKDVAEYYSKKES